MVQRNYFYVLYCKDQTLYGGYTTDLKRRLSEHNSGLGAKYTRPKGRRPVKFLYAEAYETRSQAMQAEYAFKQQSRKKKEAFLKDQGILPPYDKFNELVINYRPVGEEGEPDEKPEEL